MLLALSPMFTGLLKSLTCPHRDLSAVSKTSTTRFSTNICLQWELRIQCSTVGESEQTLQQRIFVSCSLTFCFLQTYCDDCHMQLQY